MRFLRLARTWILASIFFIGVALMFTFIVGRSPIPWYFHACIWGFTILATGGSGLLLCSEIRDWNGGVCRETGAPWIHFDTDSQGGRAYSSGDRRIWLSWIREKAA